MTDNPVSPSPVWEQPMLQAGIPTGFSVHGHTGKSSAFQVRPTWPRASSPRKMDSPIAERYRDTERACTLEAGRKQQPE